MLGDADGHDPQGVTRIVGMSWCADSVHIVPCLDAIHRQCSCNESQDQVEKGVQPGRLVECPAHDGPAISRSEAAKQECRLDINQRSTETGSAIIKSVCMFHTEQHRRYRKGCSGKQTEKKGE